MPPYSTSLSTLQSLLDHFPPGFPEELAVPLRAHGATLAADPSASPEAIDPVIIECGRSTWPYRKTWEEYYAREGRADEAAAFLGVLGPSLADRVRADTASANRLPGDIVHLPEFERYSLEERLLIEDGLLGARHDTAQDLAARLADGVFSEYDDTRERWEQERIAIDARLERLRAMAVAKPQLASEIADTIHEYELGFSRIIGREPSVADLDAAIREYEGRS